MKVQRVYDVVLFKGSLGEFRSSLSREYCCGQEELLAKAPDPLGLGLYRGHINSYKYLYESQSPTVTEWGQYPRFRAQGSEACRENSLSCCRFGNTNTKAHMKKQKALSTAASVGRRARLPPRT